jgi:hypothetical protein
MAVVLCPPSTADVATADLLGSAELSSAGQSQVDPASAFKAEPAAAAAESQAHPSYAEQAATFSADFKGLPWNVWGFFHPAPTLFAEAAARADVAVASGTVHPRDRGHLWEPSDMIARWLPRLEARMGGAWGAEALFSPPLPLPPSSDGQSHAMPAAAEAGAGAAEAGAGTGAGATRAGAGAATVRPPPPPLGAGQGGAASACDETAEELVLRPLCLDLGCGAGRDAVWAALRGWRVLALDSDARGLARCAAGNPTR